MGLETPTTELALTAARAVAPELVAAAERSAVIAVEDLGSHGLNLVELAGGKAAVTQTLGRVESASTFGELKGIVSANKAPGVPLPMKDLPIDGLDRNGELFQRMSTDRMGISLDKLNEGRIAILHPRFRFPEKQLWGKLAQGHDVALWGNAQEGVGVVEYETLASRKGYLSSANSVVRIGIRTDAAQPENFARFVGSGVLVGSPEQGLVITNEHVVAGAQSIAVETTTGQRFAATVLKTEPARDLAMVQLNDVPEGIQFPVARIGASEQIVDGSKVVAIGHHGALKGLIASPGTYRWFVPQFQLDVLSMDGGLPGMSGGGVFDRSGNLVGIAAKGLQTLVPEDRALVGGVNIRDVQTFLSRTIHK